ncbi:MAG: hypothetical protein VX938_00020, partial [Myxococcota bacterium]|nr:hypothetical protein [Myxococcota bacterium]
MTQDRLARDVEVAVRQQLDQKEQVWFLDDAQLADPETLGLIGELVQRLQDDPPPHSLRLVISEQTGEGDNLSDPLHKALETLATSVDLEPLNDDELNRFLQSSGVAGSSSNQRTWVTERAQRPGDVLSVLRHLVAEGETEETDGRLVLPPDNRLQELGDVIPTELVAREEARLSRLASDDLVMLEMAAQCGRRFEADDLVRGLGESRFAILERLRRVELQTGILMDVDEADVFAFELEGTRQALLQRTRRREGPGESLPEIAREFHLQVARHQKERRAPGERVAAERVIAHPRQAGPTMQGELSRQMIEAAEDAAKVFSWGRCLSWTDQATELGVAGLELRERLRFVRARAKMSIGGQDNRDDARGELRALVDAEHVDARRCL